MGTAFGQSREGRFVVKLSDGTSYNMTQAGAFVHEDRSLAIFAQSKENITYSFQVKLKPTTDEIKSFTKGKYLFSSKSKLLDYVPGGPSTNYETEAYLALENGGKMTEEWVSARDPEIGFIEIESITADRVKGKFYCEVVQRLQVKGAKKIMEGTFDVPIVKATANAQKTPASNGQAPEKKPAPAPSASHQPTASASSKAEDAPLLGVYDVQFSVGAITAGEMGIDLDAGATLVNYVYPGDNDVSATVALHYDFSRLSFSESMRYMHIRRNNVYARLRPFTSTPNSESYAANALGVLISGLYVDMGYSSGYYYYTDLLDNRQAPNYNANGLFWGWGYNLLWRKDNRWGFSGGFGSKRYSMKLPNGSESKYKARAISLGVVYNLIWKD